MSKDLTIKQEKFCAEYIRNGGNATEAYNKAFGKGNRANQTTWARASLLLNTDKVKIRIETMRRELKKRHEVNLDKLSENIMLVIEESKEVVDRYLGRGKRRKKIKRLYAPDRLLRATMDAAKLHGLIIDKSDDVSKAKFVKGGRVIINGKQMIFEVGEPIEETP